MATQIRLETQVFSPPQQPDAAWLEMIGSIVDVRGKLVLDMGCGTGMYTKALADMGAAHVYGLDESAEALQEARRRYANDSRIDFVCASPCSTGLIAERYDCLLMRALMQQMKPQDLRECLVEAYRLLKTGGTLLIQEQLQEDYLIPGSETHIRGYFFSRYPQLVDQRLLNRVQREVIQQALQNVGFQDLSECKVWETRGTYASLDALAQELFARAMRSPAYSLVADDEIQDILAYVAYLEEHLPGKEKKDQAIVEQECWTVWSAHKGSRNIA